MKYWSIRLLLPLFVTTFCVKAAEHLAPETHPEIYTPYGNAGVSDWQTFCQQREQHLTEFYNTVDELNKGIIDAHGAALLSDAGPSDWKACQERNQHLTNAHRHSAAVYRPATVTKKNRLPQGVLNDIHQHDQRKKGSELVTEIHKSAHKKHSRDLLNAIHQHDQREKSKDLLNDITHLFGSENSVEYHNEALEQVHISPKVALPQDLRDSIRYHKYDLNSANSYVLLEELNQLHQKIENSSSDFSIDQATKKRKHVLQKLAQRAGLMAMALDRQDKYVSREQKELNQTTAALANYTVPSSDLVSHLHGLLEWYTTYQATTDEEKKLTTQEKIARIFQPGELYLDRMSDTKKIPAVKETNTIHAVEAHEHKLDLASIPQKHVIQINETGHIRYQTDKDGNFIWQPREGKLPLEVCADFAEQTYKGWYTTWNTPRDTTLLMDVEKALLQVHQDFEKATDVSTRAKLAVRKRALTDERDEILRSIKGKVLGLMHANIGEYSSNPDHGLLGLIAKRDNMQARIAAEQAKDLDHLARLLAYLTADDRANSISTQQAISNLFAGQQTGKKVRITPISAKTITELAQATDKLLALINNKDDYILEQPAIEPSVPAEDKKDQPQVASSEASTSSASSSSVEAQKDASKVEDSQKQKKSKKRKGKGKVKTPSIINS